MTLFRRFRRRTTPSGPAGTQPPQRAHRTVGPEGLTPAEHAHLAILAERYGCGDPRAGMWLADELRKACPGVPDADLMRAVLVLGHMARLFNRRELTATDALASFLHAGTMAALDLSQWHRDGVPR